MDNGDTICPVKHYANDEFANQLQKTIILPVGDSIYYVFAVNISDSLRLGLKTLPKGGYDLLEKAPIAQSDRSNAENPQKRVSTRKPKRE